jgi:hypothetical protein
MPRGQVVFHLPRHLLQDQQMPAIYHELRRGFLARGAEVAIRHRESGALQNLPAGADFHIVHNGGGSGACLLNSIVAYLLPYFYFDPLGVYFQSSTYVAQFDPASVSESAAVRRFETLRKRYVVPRVSRYAQTETRLDLPPGAIAVFLQDWSEPVERARFMSTRAMLQTVIDGADGRPVVVKPHPRNHGPETVELLLWLAEAHPQVLVTEANLHDILQASAVSVSICSSVAIESLLHRKPTILFGKSDLHHCAVTVARGEDWPAALKKALSQDWPYEAFVYWFFERQLRGGEVMWPPLLHRMQVAGADFKALGISPP